LCIILQSRLINKNYFWSFIYPVLNANCLFSCYIRKENLRITSDPVLSEIKIAIELLSRRKKMPILNSRSGNILYIIQIRIIEKLTCLLKYCCHVTLLCGSNDAHFVCKVLYFRNKYILPTINFLLIIVLKLPLSLANCYFTTCGHIGPDGARPRVKRGGEVQNDQSREKAIPQVC
jgi:hypothetical protein